MTLPVEGERKEWRTEGETRERAGGESRWEEKDERLGEERLVIATIILENACPAGNAMSAVVQSEVENMC